MKSFLGMYILDDGNNSVACPDVIEWGKWFEENSHRRKVSRNTVGWNFPPFKKMLISTVFLGLDHANFGDDKPLLFETMVFYDGSWMDIYCKRCSTYAEALEQHKAGVVWARKRYVQFWKKD